MSVIESHQQQKQNTVYEQVISGANINVFTIKPKNCSNTSLSSKSPAFYPVRGGSAENLPPPENSSVYHSAAASRANVGCGQAVSFSRTVSQGAYIIPNPSTLSLGSSVSSRVPLATLQQSNKSFNMPQTKRVHQSNYDSLASNNSAEESHMEQDDNIEAKSSQIFQLYSNSVEHGNQPTVSKQADVTQINPPAAKRLKLRDSWSR